MPVSAAPQNGPAVPRQQQLALLDVQRRWIAGMVAKGHKGGGWFKVKERALMKSQRQKMQAVDPGLQAEVSGDLMSLLREHRMTPWASQLANVGITTLPALKNVEAESELPQGMPGPTRRVLISEIHKMNSLGFGMSHPLPSHSPAVSPVSSPSVVPAVSPPPSTTITYQRAPQQYPPQQQYQPQTQTQYQAQPQQYQAPAPAQAQPQYQAQPQQYQAQAQPQAQPQYQAQPQQYQYQAPPSAPSASPPPMSTPYTPPPQQSIDTVAIRRPNDNQLYNETKPDEHAAPQQLVACGVNGCTRKFSTDRVEKHRGACAMSGKQRQMFRTHRVPEEAEAARKDEPVEPRRKPTNWREQSRSFRAVCGRTPQDELEEPVADNRVACPSCGRKFSEKVADRHIPSCAERTRRNPPAVNRSNSSPPSRTTRRQPVASRIPMRSSGYPTGRPN